MNPFSMHSYKFSPGNICSIIMRLRCLYSVLSQCTLSSKLKRTLVSSSQVWACDSYTYSSFFPNLIPAWCHDNYICMTIKNKGESTKYATSQSGYTHTKHSINKSISGTLMCPRSHRHCQCFWLGGKDTVQRSPGALVSTSFCPKPA